MTNLKLKNSDSPEKNTKDSQFIGKILEYNYNKVNS